MVMEELMSWREVSLYRSDTDYIFPSIQKNGTQPLQPEMILRRHVRPAPVRLLRENGVNMKVAQELLRHANSRITLDIYQRTVTDERRAAQELVLRDLLGETLKHPKSARISSQLSTMD
jgi:integrase